MIEVQMRRQHQVDRVGGEARVGERVIEVTRAVERVDVTLLRVHLVAGAAVDDHPAPLRFHDERPHRELYPVAVVGWRLLLPQRARHDAEHRAPVEPERTVADACQLEIAPRHALRRQVHPGWRRLFELDEHAVGRPRVNERHLRALGARTRLLVHEAHAARLQVRQDRADVLHAQRDVMDARPALLDELRDRGIGRGRFEQFERGRPDRDEMGPDTLRLHLLRRFDLEAERVAIEGERVVDVLHRDPHMIEDSFHTRPMISAAAA